MKKLTFICMTIIATLFFGSCRGPQGPEGPAGNANVASSTVTVYPRDWYWDNETNTSWRVDIDYAAINMGIHEYGAVLVYMNDANTWKQLPMTFYYSQIDNQGVEQFYSSSLEVSSYQGGVSIFWTENDFFDGRIIDTHDFKIVVIAAGLYKDRQDVDYSNYEAVKTAFQLAD